jgi:hypothetical protein
MADILRDGMTWLASSLASGASQSVTYRRGSATGSVSAVVGRLDIGLSSPYGGVSLQSDDLDFIVRVADLSAFTEPRVADRIDYNGRRYTVAKPDDQTPHFRRDEDGLTFRIHTKYSGAIT